MVGSTKRSTSAGGSDRGSASSLAPYAKPQAKKKFKMDFGGGPKVCELCKASSKDVGKQLVREWLTTRLVQ
eukprot:4256785-Amphidinium_carterae.1